MSHRVGEITHWKWCYWIVVAVFLSTFDMNRSDKTRTSLNLNRSYIQNEHSPNVGKYTIHGSYRINTSAQYAAFVSKPTYLLPLSFGSLAPPFGCQISATRFSFLVVFWGSNFRPDWRIQVPPKKTSGFWNLLDIPHQTLSNHFSKKITTHP